MPAGSKKRVFAIEAGVNLRRTVTGSKQPLMIGPTEFRWSTRTPDGTGALLMKRVSETKLEAEAWGDGAEWMLNQAPLLAGSDDDVAGFEPPTELRDLWRRHKFLLGRTDRPWDAVVAGILGQKVQGELALRSRRQLARRFGDPAPGPVPGWILPGADTVADMAYHDFHGVGVERKRADTIIRAAKELRRIPDLTKSKTPREVRARLEHIRGIGAWTSNMITASAMGDADAVPVGDYHFPNTVAWHLAKEPRADDERMLELLEPFAGHRWRIIRLCKSSGSAPKYGPRLALNADGIHLGT